MLTERKFRSHTYYVDSNDEMQGEYFTYWGNGSIKQHSYVLDGFHHGELIMYDMEGIVESRKVYLNGKVLIEDATHLTDEDRFELSLKHAGLKWITKL